jgi:hypothetical protein
MGHAVICREAATVFEHLNFLSHAATLVQRLRASALRLSSRATVVDSNLLSFVMHQLSFAMHQPRACARTGKHTWNRIVLRTWCEMLQ